MSVKTIDPEVGQLPTAWPIAATAGKPAASLRDITVCHVSPVRSRLDARTYYMQMLPSVGLGVRTLLIGPHGRNSERADVEMVPISMYRNRALRVLLALTAAVRAGRVTANLYHLHNPELIPAGLILKFTFRKKVIYDAQEDFPSMMLTKTYLPRKIRPLIGKVVRLVEWFAARSFDGFIVADSGTLRAVARTGRSKKLVFYNLPNLEFFPEPPAGHKQFDFVYRGGLSERAGTFVLLEALRLLVRKGMNVRLLLFGYVDTEQTRSLIQAHINKLDLNSHIVLGGRIDHSEMARTLSQAMIAVSPLMAIPKFLRNIPVKVFECWACGLPVVCSDLPPIRPFFKNNEYGLLVPPGDSVALANAMEYLSKNPQDAQRMGIAGRKAVVERCNNAREIHKLLSFYSQILSAQ
jgi:glycosyltransferase involved in cell wall biosynthesis